MVIITIIIEPWLRDTSSLADTVGISDVDSLEFRFVDISILVFFLAVDHDISSRGLTSSHQRALLLDAGILRCSIEIKLYSDIVFQSFKSRGNCQGRLRVGLLRRLLSGLLRGLRRGLLSGLLGGLRRGLLSGGLRVMDLNASAFVS